MACRFIKPLCFGLIAVAVSQWLLAAEKIDFDSQIAPIFASRCLECHSGAEPKGKLDLSQSKSLIVGGESGAVFVAGNPEGSLLWQRIDADEMPPKHPLPASERAIVKA